MKSKSICINFNLCSCEDSETTVKNYLIHEGARAGEIVLSSLLFVENNNVLDKDVEKDFFNMLRIHYLFNKYAFETKDELEDYLKAYKLKDESLRYISNKAKINIELSPTNIYEEEAADNLCNMSAEKRAKRVLDSVGHYIRSGRDKAFLDYATERMLFIMYVDKCNGNEDSFLDSVYNMYSATKEIQLFGKGDDNFPYAEMIAKDLAKFDDDTLNEIMKR